MISVTGTAMGNSDWPAGQVGEHHLGIDAEEMIHRGDEIAG
jgi:hypothetical protein